MTQRLNYMHHSPEMAKKLTEFSMNVKKESSLDKTLLHLVDIRASLLNGCGFCVDMHVKEAKIHGERELRIYHVSIWRESTLFSERERAAFEWVEAVTKLSKHGVSDKVYNLVREQFSEKEISDLTFAIAAINAWNRLSISFRSVPGSADSVYGLTKADLN